MTPSSLSPLTAMNAASASSVLPDSSPLEDAKKTAATSSQGQTNTRNAQILEASLQVSIQAGNGGLALLYRTAVDGINATLEAELGPQAIQNAIGQDNSPEGTAGRIVALSTAMFDAYAARYPDKDMIEVAKDFVNIIRSGFEQGFKEAEDILNSLGVLPDVEIVAQGIAQTFELVHKGYDDWLAQKISALQSPANSDLTPSESA